MHVTNMGKPRYLMACQLVTLADGNKVVVAAGGLEQPSGPASGVTEIFRTSNNAWTPGPENLPPR